MAVLFAVFTEEESKIHSLTINPGTAVYSINERNFQLSTVINEGPIEQENYTPGSVPHKMTIELQSMLPEGEWMVLPHSTDMDYFVTKNLQPLPTLPEKKIYINFFVSVDEDTLVVAKMKVCLRAGSVRSPKIS